MEHRLIKGGEQFLPFARSCIAKLKKLGMPYANQSYEIDGVSVKVRVEPGHEYISLDGSQERFTLACYGLNPSTPSYISEFFTLRVPSGKVKKVSEYAAGTFNGCVLYNGVPYPMSVSQTRTPRTFNLPYSARNFPLVDVIAGSYVQTVDDIVDSYGPVGTTLNTTRTTVRGDEAHIRSPNPASITTRVVVNTYNGSIRDSLTYSFTHGFVFRDQVWDNRRSQQWARDSYFDPNSGFPALEGLISTTPGTGRLDWPITSVGVNETDGGSTLYGPVPVSFRSTLGLTTPLSEIASDQMVQIVDPARFTGRMLAPSWTPPVPLTVRKVDAETGLTIHTAFKKTIFTFCVDPLTPEVLLNQRDAVTKALTGINVMIPVDTGYNISRLNNSSTYLTRLAQADYIHIGATHTVFEWVDTSLLSHITALKHNSTIFDMDVNPAAIARRSLINGFAVQTYVAAADGYDVRGM